MSTKQDGLTQRIWGYSPRNPHNRHGTFVGACRFGLRMLRRTLFGWLGLDLGSGDLNMPVSPSRNYRRSPGLQTYGEPTKWWPPDHQLTLISISKQVLHRQPVTWNDAILHNQIPASGEQGHMAPGRRGDSHQHFRCRRGDVTAKISRSECP